MRRARAVLPAFASDVYYTAKASSSVAAALICGTPLLAGPQLLRAYSYLPPEATFAQVCALLSATDPCCGRAGVCHTARTGIGLWRTIRRCEGMLLGVQS